MLRTVNGHWIMAPGTCVKGYTLVLSSWTPRVGNEYAITSLKVWVQFHLLPQEYFSKENGELLGARAGKVLSVDFSDDTPAAWSNYLRAHVEINIEDPVVSATSIGARKQSKKERRLVASPPVISASSAAPSTGFVPVYNQAVSKISRRMKETKGPRALIWIPKETANNGRDKKLPENGNEVVSVWAGGGKLAEDFPCSKETDVGFSTHKKLTLVNLKVAGEANGPAQDLCGPVYERVGGEKGLSCNVVGGLEVDNFNSVGKKPVGPIAELCGEASLGVNLANGHGSSSINAQETNVIFDEGRALSNFFQAQDTFLQELKMFGNLDLFEIKNLGGDIGVKTSSEQNERTTPIKKRKIPESSTPLHYRPWKI
ncbi:hypothetical protein G4B88_002135 [Cannabis sativa]|uniref:DUF4283 domain-containing protein n=1 Tax=Cannabis sativa TaxID=3483 RepID=A0A7J6EYF4_CANSA|nr:hypothetical protein G4B88_002135 [Cannabis sativa]